MKISEIVRIENHWPVAGYGESMTMNDHGDSSIQRRIRLSRYVDITVTRFLFHQIYLPIYVKGCSACPTDRSYFRRPMKFTARLILNNS